MLHGKLHPFCQLAALKNFAALGKAIWLQTAKCMAGFGFLSERFAEGPSAL
jgi:hypothetical protein